MPLELLLAVLLGCGTGFYYGLPPAIAADVAPVPYRAVCISVYRFWRDMGNIVATLIFAVIYRIWGATPLAAELIMQASAVLLAAGALTAWWLMKETYSRRQQLDS